MRCAPLGDTALTVELGDASDAATLARVQALARSLEVAKWRGDKEIRAEHIATALQQPVSATVPRALALAGIEL